MLYDELCMTSHVVVWRYYCVCWNSQPAEIAPLYLSTCKHCTSGFLTNTVNLVLLLRAKTVWACLYSVAGGTQLKGTKDTEDKSTEQQIRPGRKRVSTVHCHNYCDLALTQQLLMPHSLSVNSWPSFSVAKMHLPCFTLSPQCLHYPCNYPYIGPSKIGYHKQWLSSDVNFQC